MRRADHLRKAGVQRMLGEPLIDGFGDAEIDDLGRGLAVFDRHQHVGGLEVAMDDPLLMGMLHRLADGDEQLQPLAQREVAFIAILGDGDALNQLHHEVGPAGVGGAGVQHLGDVAVVHQGQGLLFCLEAGNDLRLSMPAFRILSATAPPHRLLLLGQEHHAKTAFADLLQQLVGANLGTSLLGDWRIDFGSRGFQEAPDFLPSREQSFNSAP